MLISTGLIKLTVIGTESLLFDTELAYIIQLKNFMKSGLKKYVE